MSRQSVYRSVWGTTDAVNATSSLSLNRDNAEFPSHEEQEEIAEGFKLRSKAEFDKICLAVDGMLVWTVQPTRADCEELRVGERQFHCARKDKFGMNLMAGCDHMCRFRWANIRHPGLTSDYLAFATSDLGVLLEREGNNILKPGYTMVGDNAWVPRLWMAVPIPGHCISGTDDAYNFYHSQVRITIERAFGIFVHRWGILRRPLSVSILKVPPLIMCLMKLHNYCIDSKPPPRLQLSVTMNEAFTEWPLLVAPHKQLAMPQRFSLIVEAFLLILLAPDIISLICLEIGDLFRHHKQTIQWN